MPEITEFAREFVRSPIHTAALFPSLGPLCRQAIAPLPEHGDPVVVDLGAGTGQVTELLVERLAGRGRHIAVEFNPRMAEVPARAAHLVHEEGPDLSSEGPDLVRVETAQVRGGADSIQQRHCGHLGSPAVGARPVYGRRPGPHPRRG